LKKIYIIIFLSIITAIIITIIISYIYSKNKYTHPLTPHQKKSGLPKKRITTIKKEDKIIFPNYFPDSIISQLDLIQVKYINYSNIIDSGYLLVNKKIHLEVQSIFKDLFTRGFLISKVSTGVEFNFSDSLMMENNITSCFNYRQVIGSRRLSQHALGMAIDINPRQNPFIYSSDKKYPLNSIYDTEVLGTVFGGGICEEVFKKYNWKWGGDWRSFKDYQHFSKNGH